jgi:GTPase SAR1 family protein
VSSVKESPTATDAAGVGFLTPWSSRRVFPRRTNGWSVAEFLESFDAERASLLGALKHFEEVWGRFQERRGIDVDDQTSDSLIASELALVRADLEATKFTVGVFGLIKRGKSTLLNALIGREVSSMHVTPETAVPVYVSYGDQPQATVHFADGTRKHVGVEDVKQYTSQKHNANNQLGVTHVEQEVPVGFLRNGTRLIDTPGLDDAEADETYTQRTMQELDVTDAGIVVFLSPPTVGATEMGFLTEVVSRNIKKTFLVCNMYPQHFHDPETRNSVLEYTGRRIIEACERAGMTGEVRVYPVCALEAWEARQADDIDKWKASGADRLLRDVENYLAGHAGAQVLREGAERIVKASEMARAEVGVRLRLLSDPEALQGVRTRVEGNIGDLERRFDEAVAMALTDVSPLKLRIRGLLMQPFPGAKREIDELGSMEDLDAFSRTFRRKVEVAGELASRQFSEGFGRVVERLRRSLEDEFHAVMSDLTPNLPRFELATSAMLVTPEQLKAVEAAQKKTRQLAGSGAAAGGLLGGSTAVVAAGALLGPLGLLGGALVGYKLSQLIGEGRSLDKARDAIKERLDEISADLIRDFDKQVEEAVEALRHAVVRRRKLFAADLYQQFDLVQSLGSDPELLETHRRDAERFTDAFSACADRARSAVVFSMAGV